MGYYEKLLNIEKIEKALIDEESKKLFQARIDYMITKKEDEYYKVSDRLHDDWHCAELEKFMESKEYEGIVIFGCGHDGKRTKIILDNCRHFPACYCDSDKDKVGKIVDGLKVISVEKLLEEYQNYLVVVASRKYSEEIKNTLLDKGVSEDRILFPKYGVLVATRGNQYFDVFDSVEGEVFVDAGAYNGNTTLEFVKWTNNKYLKSILLEPMSDMIEYISERSEIKKLKNIYI